MAEQPDLNTPGTRGSVFSDFCGWSSLSRKWWFRTSAMAADTC